MSDSEIKYVVRAGERMWEISRDVYDAMLSNEWNYIVMNVLLSLIISGRLNQEEQERKN